MVLVYSWPVHVVTKFIKKPQRLHFSTIQISKNIFSTGPIMVAPYADIDLSESYSVLFFPI